MIKEQSQTVTGGRLLSSAQVSEWIGVPATTLRYWRWAGQGPKWFKLGSKTVRYRESDVKAWLDEAYAEANGAA